MAIKGLPYENLSNYHAVAEENLFALIYAPGYLLGYAEGSLKLVSSCERSRENGWARLERGVRGKGAEAEPALTARWERNWREAWSSSASRLPWSTVSGLAGQGWAGKFPVLVTEQCFSSPCLEPEGFSWPNLNQTSLSVGLMLKSFSLIIFKQVLLRIINVFMRIGNDAVRREKKNLYEKSFRVTFMCIPSWLLFWNCSYSKVFFFFFFSVQLLEAVFLPLSSVVFLVDFKFLSLNSGTTHKEKVVQFRWEGHLRYCFHWENWEGFCSLQRKNTFSQSTACGTSISRTQQPLLIGS